MNASATQPFDSNISSGFNYSLWTKTTNPLMFEKLNQDIDTDNLVVGGGIAGLTTAYCLLKSGQKVVLVEDGYIGSGESGRTTAHLTCALDARYYELEKLFGKKNAKLAGYSHQGAIQFIENTVKIENMDCSFKRVPGYLFLSKSDTKNTLNKEYKATIDAGLMTQMLEQVPSLYGEEGKRCIKFPDQAQIHILKYLEGLTTAIIEMGGTIYTQTKATDITKNGAKSNGYYIKANHIVVATNTPINDFVSMHTKQWAYRTYVIAAKIPKRTLPYALWWDTGDQDSKWVSAPYHYVRIEEYNADYDLLISGGEDHKVGQADKENIAEEDRYAKLIEWTKKRFPTMGDIVHQWSGQVMEPVDSLGYIGKNSGDENIYIITGHSGNGITYGTIAGILLTDLINGKDNSMAELYSPARVTVKATPEYLQEVANMASQYIDWVTTENVKDVSELKAGQGAIILTGIKKIAAYRDEQNNVHTCTAICPHLGAILQWNADEKTFDCPAHGSRFTVEGTVINGPANCDLKNIELED
ncbi:glycine/D-amino acid oxidase-like deaminating enzyme/nitrite reductase/ring-hydroxylating ferredoxin subunit [Flavobacterium sp. PL11]|uniref:FAD-dependent oxidoreductase n=1 Tax=Flavobacterium sp. PL11 TaxID=3071717 RepID=UPI002DF8FA5F|nr:glycine/D-amino acid oxidase-like deaminating enzyme/nitrite reductase/ring-hydroxylating ferredoxin subunit [Flavobacterium sp. PL11]